MIPLDSYPGAANRGWFVTLLYFIALYADLLAFQVCAGLDKGYWPICKITV